MTMTSERKKKTMMHGDLVNGLCYTVFLPAYLSLWRSDLAQGTNGRVSPASASSGGVVNGLFAVVAVCSWVSWLRDCPAASELAGYGITASAAAMNLGQWPHEGHVFVFPQYMWSLVVVSFNPELSFPRKMRISAFALASALFVSHWSPLVNFSDAVPVLLGFALIHAVVLRMALSASPMSPLLARLLLAGAFAAQVTHEIGRVLSGAMPVQDFGYSVLKTGLFTSLGLAAAGAFQRASHRVEEEVHQKEGIKDSMEALTHELRSPLQGIMGTVSCLLDNESVAASSSAEVRESLSIILASSRHLLTLINNLLDVRKCDARMMDEFPLSPIPLIASLAEATAFCRPMATITGVELRLDLDRSRSGSRPPLPGGWRCDDSDRTCVVSNVVRLQQMIINIVSNAIKYSPRNGTVRLETEIMTLRQARDEMMRALAVGIPLSESPNNRSSSGDSALVAVISISDAGPGIAPGVAPRVFRKFAELATPSPPSSSSSSKGNVVSVIGGSTVAQPTGTGLGLNLCVKFVRRMNGNIWVANSPDGASGSRFSFCLPVAEEPVDPVPVARGGCLAGNGSAAIGRVPSLAELGQITTQTSEPETEPATCSSISDLRVLVVDDTVINLKVIARMLRDIGVGDVSVAESGRQALSVLERESFSLVITDIQMPEMDGIELSRAIRESETIPVKPVVVGLTAATSDEIEELCASAGMSHLIHKPITKKQLQSFLADRLRVHSAKDGAGDGRLRR
jgi:signal transduction histidine kinase